MSSPAVTRHGTVRIQNKSKADDGVLSLSAVLSELRHMESRLQVHTERIVGELANKLQLIESTLSQKIEDEISLFRERANELEKRLSTVESELKVVDSLNKEINVLKCKLENSQFAKKQLPDHSTDAIIFGIPFEDKENLKSIFNQISHGIDFLPPQIRDIFRIKPKTPNNNNSAVIIKFYTPYDRNRVLKAFSDYRRKIKSTIHLGALGFNWDSTFKIYESLDQENRHLLQIAHKYRRDGKLRNVFSSRGSVFVRAAKNLEAVLVADESNFAAIIGS